MIIGAQLYSVRNLCGQDSLKDTFRSLKEMGYQSVQVSGFKYDPSFVRSTADEFGLSIGLTHTGIEEIINNTDAVIEKHKILGADVVGIGGPWPNYIKDNIIDYKNLIKNISPAVAKLRNAGLDFAYHNHFMEFEKYEGRYLMDILFEDTDWLFTFDVGWAEFAGQNAAELVRKYAERLKYVHLKDFKDKVMVPIGCGDVHTADIIKALNQVGTKVAYVEQDNAVEKEDPMGEMKTSIDNIRKSGVVL